MSGMSKFDPHLNFKRVLVCRPKQEASELVQALKKKGISALAFPTLEIRPLADRTEFDTLLSQCSVSDSYIFVSPNAVTQAFAIMTSDQANCCKNAPCFAVGLSTHQALTGQGVKQVLSPYPDFNSESLLAVPDLQAVAGRQFYILSGQEGRDLLEKTLKERGARVQKIVAYEAICPSVNPHELIQSWKQEPFDCVVITSLRMLQNLWEILGDEKYLLQESTITVMSERIKNWAVSHGITRWLEIQDPSTGGLVNLFSAESY